MQSPSRYVILCGLLDASVGCFNYRDSKSQYQKMSNSLEDGSTRKVIMRNEKPDKGSNQSTDLPISNTSRRLAIDFAPLVWLHPDEVFFPSNVDFFLNHLQVRDKNEDVIQKKPTPENIVSGSKTSDYHLNTEKKVQCSTCYENFFHGQKNLKEVKVPVFIHEFKDDCGTVDIDYQTFYPFNFGKNFCVGVIAWDNCLGVHKILGNHVGDWEHVRIRFQHQAPRQMWVSTHDFGAYYNFDPTLKIWKFDHGINIGGDRYEVRRKREATEEQTIDWRALMEKVDEEFGNMSKKDGKPSTRRLFVEYPNEIGMDSSHPVLFSAKGSHGLWAQPGEHRYMDIEINHLSDFTEKGKAWKLWENVDFINAGMIKSAYTKGRLSWLGFEGNWGNVEKVSCGLVGSITSFCGIMPGPGGAQRFFRVPRGFSNPPTC